MTYHCYRSFAISESLQLFPAELLLEVKPLRILEWQLCPHMSCPSHGAGCRYVLKVCSEFTADEQHAL